MPNPDYEALGSKYQTPQTVAAEHGRSHKGLGIALSVLLVLALGGGAAFFLHSRLSSGSQAGEAQSAGASSASGTSQDTGQTSEGDEHVQDDSSAEVATSDVAASDADANGSSIVGHWVGELRGKSSDETYCYGAQVQPLVLDIKSEEGTGKVKADITVCYHNHAMGDNDIDSDPADVYLTFEDVTLTNYGGNMEYHADVSGANQDGQLSLVFHIKGSAMQAEVDETWVDPVDGDTEFEYRDKFDMRLG